MKEQILKELFSNQKVYTYAKKTCGGDDFLNDLVQELYIYLHDKDEAFVIDLFNKGALLFYAYRIMYYSWNSPTSPFYRKFRNTNFNQLTDFGYYDDVTPEEDIFDYAKWINKIEGNIKEAWYNGKVHTEGVLMLKYLELGSYREVEKEMGVSYRTVQSIVQRYAKKLKDE